SGNGTNLSNLNAGNISSGTVADARLSTNGALLNNTQTFTGAKTFNNAGNSFLGTHSGNGTGLTSLNASNLTIGTVSDARLSANVTLLNVAQTNAADKTFANSAQLFLDPGAMLAPALSFR